MPSPLRRGGIIAIVVLLAFIFLGGGGGPGISVRSPARPSADGSAVGEIAQECQTGADATSATTAGSVAVINSVQSYWGRTLRNYEPAGTLLRRRDPDRLRRGFVGHAALLLPADRYVYIDLGFFDELQSPLGACGGPLPRPTSSRTSTAITSRT